MAWIARICDENKQALPEREDFWIKGNGPVRVGRHPTTECPIAFSNDKSVSRDHAELFVDNGILYVMDKGSKYKTNLSFPDEEPDEEGQMKKHCLEQNERNEVNEGQLIQFGAAQSFVVVCKLQLQVCLTRLHKDKKKMVVDAIKRLGGRIVENVDTATHIVTSPPFNSMTSKLMAAVVYGQEKKLIIPEWFEFALAETANVAVPIPHESSYFPEVDTSKVQLENRDMPRGGLLRGKTVLIARKVDEAYECVLQGCGAKTIRGYGENLVPRYVYPNSNSTLHNHP